jgi:hypothetical protein
MRVSCAQWVTSSEDAAQYFYTKGAFGYDGFGLSLKASGNLEQKLATSLNSVFGLSSVLVKDQGGEFNLQPSAMPTLSSVALSVLGNQGPTVFESLYGSYFVLSTRRFAQLLSVVEIASTAKQSSQAIQASFDASFSSFSASFQSIYTAATQQSNLRVKIYVAGSAASCPGVNPYVDPVGVVSTCYNQMLQNQALTDGLETVLMRFSDLPSYALALAAYSGADRLGVSGTTTLADQTPLVQQLVNTIWETGWFLQQTGMTSLNVLALTARANALAKEMDTLYTAIAALVTTPARSDTLPKLQVLQAVVGALEKNLLWVDRSESHRVSRSEQFCLSELLWMMVGG